MTNNYDRVTSILAPFSGMDKIDPIILQRASERGSLVHALCQGILDGIEVEVPEHLKGYVDSFSQWSEGKSFINNPGRMFCNTEMLTGECDGIYLDKDNNEILFDLKTSAQEGNTWRYQAAGYSFLLSETQKIVPKEEQFIRLSKDGKYPKVHVYHFEENLKIFMKCVDIFRTFYKNKIKIDGEYL